VPSGERAKSLAELDRLATGLLRRGAGRDAILVALGGGAVGDLAGFAAATYMRGVEWIAVPTTLLAMVDASIGGKTAVDIDGTKNAIGAFHQPRAVLIGTDFLRTLPASERRSGLGEVVKYGMIADRELFALLERAPRPWRQARPTADARLVVRCTRIKARYVAADEREAGARAALNFGHTLGHVLESTGGWTHGESVGLGMLAACDIAVAMQVAPPRIRTRLQRLLRELGLPTRARRLPTPAAVRRVIGRDKKARDGVPRFVLTPRIGAVSVGHRVPEAFVLRALLALRDDHPAPRARSSRAVFLEDDDV
jgi:3-dehydroquinate synthase